MHVVEMAAITCQKEELSAATLALTCLDSDHGSTVYYEALAIYHLSSKCGLLNELLVLGKLAFWAQDICRRGTLIKEQLWRVASTQKIS